MAEIHFIGNYLDDNTYPGVRKSTLDHLVEYAKDKKVLGLDIETSRKYPKNKYPEKIYKPGLDPYVSRVVMIQIGDLDNIFVIDTRSFDARYISRKLDFLNWNKDLLLVGHNLKFEGRHLLHNYKWKFANVWDTMLCEINLTNGMPYGYSLADLAGRYLGAKTVDSFDLFSQLEEGRDYLDSVFEAEEQILIDKSVRMGFVNIGDKPFNLEQIKYGADDITMPLQIMNKQKANKYNPMVCHRLENKFSQVLAKLENTGMHFDSQAWLDIYNKKHPVYRKLHNKLDNFVIGNVPAFTGSLDLFNPENGSCKVQWSSSKQVIALFKHLGFCPKEKSKQTKRMEYTVGDKALFKLLTNENKGKYYRQETPDIVDDQTLILNYLLYKKYEQACTTFGKDWLKYVHPITGRVHSSYRQILSTGRMSSTNPNLQNIPSDKRYRMCFTAPDNYKIVNADYASQEIRVLAEVSGVKDMQDFFVLGDDVFGSDFHSFTADKMFKIIYEDPEYHVPPKELEDGSDNPAFNHKKERNAAKAINFKINYGGSAFTLKDDFGVTEEEAQVFIDNYLKAFPGLEEDFERVKKFAVKNGYIVIDNFTGRRWFDPKFKEMVQAKEEALSHYPPEWREMSKEEKEEWKAEWKPVTSPLWKKHFTLKSKLERNALNYRIQGLSGGMTKLACILIYDWLHENGIENAYLNNIVHDETNSECFNDPELLKVYSKVVEDSMKKAGTYFCIVVPMDAVAVVSFYWTH